MTRASSITARLTLFFAASSAAVLLAFGHLVGTLVAAHFEAQDLEQLRGKLELVRHALARAGDGEALRQNLAAAMVGHHDLSVEVVGADGEQLFQAGAAQPLRSLAGNAGATEVPTGDPWPVVFEHTGMPLRAIVASVDETLVGQAPTTVALALDISHHRAFLDSFHAQLWLAIAAALVIAVLFGWLAARRGLAPVRAMATVAGNVSAQRLAQRLPVAGVPRELSGLAQAFNDMLARLETSFRRLSEFSSDLAHELRTPIGNLMMQTQVALSKTRTADEYREVLYSNLEEFERLARTITDMLFLAQADHGLLLPDPREVDLATEVRELFAFYEALADEGGIGLELAGEAPVRGDRLMLRRAVGNLLSNAIRHTPPGGTVRVTIGRDRSGARLVVENPGAPIPPPHLARLFDRFYRVDPSRARAGEGAGLGLAITRSIVEAHGATIAVASGDGATRFEIRFPSADSSPASGTVRPPSSPATTGL